MLLTTYEMAMKEIGEVNRLQWEAMVVDEGHRLKNKEGQLFKQLKSVRVQQRVSGTRAGWVRVWVGAYCLGVVR